VRTALGTIGRRPALGVELGIATTWLLLLAAATGAVGAAAGSSTGGSSFGAGSLWLCTFGQGGMSGMGPGMHEAGGGAVLAGGLPLLSGLPMWGLMAGAMMLPTALPAVRHVGVNSLYWRRRRAMAEFVAVYLAVWTGFGILVLGPLSSLMPTDSGLALAAALSLAALWQLTPPKRRAQRACHRARPLPPYGWRASAGVARFGLFNGGACLASCWALMLTMAVVSSARLAWMAVLTAVVLIEKTNLKPRRTALRIATLAAAAATGTALAVLLGY
jgi:predicted metal-binding membrane protein